MHQLHQVVGRAKHVEHPQQSGVVDGVVAEWQALGDWVASILGPFYELTRAQLPDCWPLHRPAVLELVWLRRMYVAAHRPDAAPSAAADWHTRWRREALANIAAAIPETWCRPGEHWVERFSHRPGPPPPRPTAPVLDSGSPCPALGCEDIAWRRQREAAAAGGPSGVNADRNRAVFTAGTPSSARFRVAISVVANPSTRPPTRSAHTLHTE